ncbi:slei family protein [Gemella sp. GH3]|uniref:slei family protein n=1 Tax=unclassified Gemella TaxID=2624949 RepID=UPI0015D022DE|nr:MULTISPECIES: slei family protein [unclassified Gemella]MBF0714014.1 slei family protein [Gemella sp. GH3.1]NYS50966.1 slei family protein [Gemella sp. GH3]
MNFEQFLEKYNELDIKLLEREQLESFRDIFFEHGMLDKALELSKLVYEKYPNDEAAVISYADNLMCLDKKDDALIVLYNSEKTAQTLLMEALIYKSDMLLDVAEQKLKSAKELAEEEELKNIIDYELSTVYAEDDKVEESLNITMDLFNREKNLQNLKSVIDNMLMLGNYVDAIAFYLEYGEEYEDAELYFAIAFAYNNMHDLEKSKNYLLKTVSLDSEFRDAYMHLGFLSKGEEAINYFEKYLSLQGYSTAVYIHLTELYRQEKQYNKIRSMVRDVLTNMGIDNDTLYISINALKGLYEVEKIYEIYNEQDIIKEDSSLLVLTLLELSEDEDYVDFVLEEINKYHPFLYDEPSYYEVLSNVYKLTGNSVIKRYIEELEIRNNYNEF